MSVFFIKALVNFEKLIRFYRQAFILYENRENLKILIEIPLFSLFRQFGTTVVDILRLHPFQNLWIYPWIYIYHFYSGYFIKYNIRDEMK